MLFYAQNEFVLFMLKIVEIFSYVVSTYNVIMTIYIRTNARFGIIKQIYVKYIIFHA